MKEIWKKWKDGYDYISGCGRVDHRDAIYVSNMGNIMGRQISITSNGYRYIRYKDKHYSIHRLVAELFIPNPDNKPYIDHINTNKADNRVINLRWVTAKENSNNLLTRKHNSDNHADFTGSNHPQARKVKDNISGLIFGCAKDYAEYIKKSPKTVRDWLCGKHPFPQQYSAHYIGGHIC